MKILSYSFPKAVLQRGRLLKAHTKAKAWERAAESNGRAVAWLFSACATGSIVQIALTKCSTISLCHVAGPKHAPVYCSIVNKAGSGLLACPPLMAVLAPHPSLVALSELCC